MKLKVLKAIYYNPEDLSQEYDGTSALSGRVTNGQLNYSGSYNDLFGRSNDPCPGTRKKLRIDLAFGVFRKKYSKVYQEDDNINLPNDLEIGRSNVNYYRPIVTWGVFIVFPIILSWFAFWTSMPLFSDTKILNEEEATTTAKIWYVDKSNDQGFYLWVMRSIFQVPFEPKYYQLTLKNESYKESHNGKKDTLPVTVSFYSLENVSMDDEEIVIDKNKQLLFSLDMGENEELLTPILESPYFMYAIRAEVWSKEAKGQISVLPVGGGVQFWQTKLASSIVFLFAWWGICLLVIKIFSLLFPALSVKLKIF